MVPMVNDIMTLTNQELNKMAKEVVKKRFKANGATVHEKDRNLLIKTEEGKNIEVLVKSIRRPTEYVLILKKHMDVQQNNLFISLVVFSGEIDPELFLVPAEAFLKPNDLLRDRPNYKEPEFGMNVSNKNMPLLNIYEFDSYIKKLTIENKI
jgi:hypothetical protein